MPSCSAAETLMLADNGIFLCIASDRITADIRPICFDGSNPFGVVSGQPRCRRRVAQRDPGVDLALTGTAKAFDNRRGLLEVILFVPDFGQPELGGSMRVTATNLGRNASLPTKLSMHFAPGFSNAVVFSSRSYAHPAPCKMARFAFFRPLRHCVALPPRGAAQSAMCPPLDRALRLSARRASRP